MCKNDPIESNNSIINKEVNQIYDCCICRQSSKATSERPIGLVALLQSTSG